MAAAFTFAQNQSPQNQAIWIDIPFIKQSAEGCGAASLAMVMQYWQGKTGKTVDQSSDAAKILEQLHAPESHGIYASALERYLKENGFQAFAFSGKWSDLLEHLQKGRPLIVALKPAASGKVLHYVVVAGIDPARGLVMFNDPAGRKLSTLDRKSFEKEWDASGTWTLLALPQKSAP